MQLLQICAGRGWEDAPHKSGFRLQSGEYRQRKNREGSEIVKVALFVTCLVDQFYPQVAEAMIAVCNRLGVYVDFPEAQTCCGQPAFNSGYVDAARSAAMSLLDAFAEYDYVISPSGSCTGMIHHYYAKLFDDDQAHRAAARDLADKTYEFSQFIVNVLGVTDLHATFPYSVTYHPSCHGTRLLGIRDEPLQLLTHVRGIELIELGHQEDCCGFGGTFAVKMADISAAMAIEKAAHVKETGAQVLVGTDMGCLMNIGGRLQRERMPVRVLHLAQLLAEGLSPVSSLTAEAAQ